MAEKKETTEKKPAAKKKAPAKKKPKAKKPAAGQVNVYGLDGKVTKSIDLPEVFFYPLVHKMLLMEWLSDVRLN